MGVSLQAGGVTFMIGQDDWKKGRNRKKGEGFRLYCTTTQDVDALAKEIQARGGKLDSEPRDQPWGTRDFSLTDPDGFKITIGADKKSVPERRTRCSNLAAVTATDTHRAIDAVWRIESPGSSPGWRGSCATSAWPRTSRRTRSWRRSSGGRSRASRTTRAPGSWPPRSTARSTCCGAAPCSIASTRSSAARSKPRQEMSVADLEAAIDDDIGDDLLRLMFTACHPVLSTEARVALTLRLLGGLTTDEIARAFLVPEPTIAQRIVRAKRALAEARRPVRGPPRGRARRPAAVGARGRLPRVQRGLRRRRPATI